MTESELIADCKVVLQFEITMDQPPKGIGPRCSVSGPSAIGEKSNASNPPQLLRGLTPVAISTCVDIQS